MIKNEMTIEELEKEYEKLNKQRDNLSKILNERKNAEEEKRRAELAAVKKEREAEIEMTTEALASLLMAYNKDYGTYFITRKNTPSFLLDLLF